MSSRSREPIRVLLVAPSIRITGGQAVQATRLLEALRQDPSLEVGFQPIGPEPPRWLGFVRRVKGVRTVWAWVSYVWQLLWRLPRYRIVHVFSAAYTSYMLWTLPARWDAPSGRCGRGCTAVAHFSRGGLAIRRQK